MKDTAAKIKSPSESKAESSAETKKEEVSSVESQQPAEEPIIITWYMPKTNDKSVQLEEEICMTEIYS